MQSTTSPYRSNNDAGVLANSLLGQMLENNSLKLPSPAQLEECNYNSFPYYFVGDEAFPLCEIMMHPFPGKLEQPEKIFNYHLSRARRVIEYAFCLLRTRWRIFSRPIKSSIKRILPLQQSHYRTTCNKLTMPCIVHTVSSIVMMGTEI